MPYSTSKNIALSVVIPAFNEEVRIVDTLRLADEYLKQQPDTYEIFVIDDGSSDTTSDVVLEMAVDIHNLKLLRFDRNQGKGWAVREGMLHANGRYRLFMDADGSTAIHHWRRAKAALDAGADIVVGSRHVHGSEIRVHQSPQRVFLGFTFRQIVKTIFGMPVNDTQNGFKAFRAEAAVQIFGRQQVPGWAFDVEILSIGQGLQYEIVEVPVTWIDDSRSRMKFSAMPRMLTDIMRIRLRAIEPRPVYQIHETPRLIRLA